MAAKKRATKTPKKQSQPKKPVNSAKNKERMMKMLKNLLFWFVLFVVSLVVVDYVVQYLNYHASVAVVNGERISKNEFYEMLEDRYGSTITSQMIDEVLIYQEGEKEGITVTDEEIGEQLTELENQYGGEDSLNEELKAVGITREQLEKQIETTLLVEKLLEPIIEITEEDKQTFFEDNKAELFPGDEDITYENAQDEVEQALLDQEMAQEVQPWLAEIRTDARIQNNVDEPKPYSFLGITREFIGELFN
ncbi:MAG: SurA N-terminal domain-containing protein [bacterium]